MKAAQMSTEVQWEVGAGVASRTKEKESEFPLGRFLAILPGALLGLVIGTFPLSLPVLYLVALFFMK